MANRVFNTGISVNQEEDDDDEDWYEGVNWDEEAPQEAGGVGFWAGIGALFDWFGGRGGDDGDPYPDEGDPPLLLAAINESPDYIPEPEPVYQGESWESIIAQGNKVGRAVQYKPNRAWRPGESDDSREVAFLAQKHKSTAPPVGQAQYLANATGNSAGTERAAFNQRVYENAPPQVGGIAAAREAIQQKAQAVVNNWVVEQPAYQRTFRAVAQYVEPPTPPDPMMLALSALRQVAQSASQAPSVQSASLSNIGLDELAQALQKTLGGGITEANWVGTVAPALAALVITAAKIAARNAPKVIKASTKVVKSVAKAPVKTAVRVASRLRPGVYHISKRVIGNRKNIWTKGDPGNARENLIQHYLDHVKDFPKIKNPQQYFNRAWSIVENPPTNALYKVYKNGTRQAIYIRAENTLVITDQYGTVASMYRPTRGYQYFKDLF